MATLWRRYLGVPVIYKIAVGFLLGVVFGALAGPQVMEALKPLGDLLVRLLKMIVAPIVLFSLVVGAASIRPSRLGRIGAAIMAYYLLTSAVAVAIGLVVAQIFQPGAGLAVAAEAAEVKPRKPPSVVEVLLNIVPTNPFAALAEGRVLQIIFFALVLGVALALLREAPDARVREAAETLFRVFDAAAEAMYRIVRGVLEYMPIGVFALVGYVVAAHGPKVLGSLAVVVAALYSGLFIHIFATYGLILALLARMSIVTFLRGAKAAMITAFVTRSSSATLPVTMSVAERQFGISRSVYAFTLPLGATINMDGTAMYQAVATLFVANVLGVQLTPAEHLAIVLTAVLASVGTAGVPGAGAIMLLMVMQSVGLDLARPEVAAAYSMILGVDVVLDMGRTMVNVTGDLVGTIVVARMERAAGAPSEA